MRILDRYLLRSFFFNYLGCLFVMVSMYVILDLFFNLDEFTEDEKPFFDILLDITDYYSYNVAYYFSQVSGVITLVAACLTLARFQWANETTAVLASGVSLHRLAAPIVVAGLCMNVLVIADYEIFLPNFAPKLARSRDDVEGKRVYELWFVKDGDRLLSAQHFRQSPGEIRGFYVVEQAGPQKRLSGTITADLATWDAANHRWNLTNGRYFDVSTDNAESIKPVRLKYYESQLDPDQLMLRKTAAWTQFLSTHQLNELAAQDPMRWGYINHIKHGRFTQPINNMILLLVGISFFLHRLPDSVLTQAVKAMGTCAAVIMLAFAAQFLVPAVGSILNVPISQAGVAWVPIFLFGPVAVLLLHGVKT